MTFELENFRELHIEVKPIKYEYDNGKTCYELGSIVKADFELSIDNSEIDNFTNELQNFLINWQRKAGY